MNNLVLKSIDLIDVDADDNQNEHSGIFGFEPTLKEEEGLGSIFLIGETVKNDENSSYIINLLASIIKKEYYSNTDISGEKALENSLKKANESLSDLKNQGNETLINSLRFIVASYAQGVLNISQIGDVQSLIIREDSITDIGEAIPDNSNENGETFFSNIASGEILDQDIIILSSSVLKDDKIKVIQTNFNKSKNFDKIEKNIRKKFVNFGEVILILQASAEGILDKPLMSSHVVEEKETNEEDMKNEDDTKDIEKILAGANSPSGDLEPLAKKSVPELKSDLLSSDIEEADTLGKNPKIKQAAAKSDSSEKKFFSMKSKLWDKKDAHHIDPPSEKKDSSSSLSSLSSNLDNKKFDWAKYLYILGIIVVGGIILYLGYLFYNKIFTDDTTQETETTETSEVNYDDRLAEIETALEEENYTEARSLIKTLRADLEDLNEQNSAEIEGKLNDIIDSIDLVQRIEPEDTIEIETTALPIENSPLAIYDMKVYYPNEEGLYVYDLDSEEFNNVHNEFAYNNVTAIEKTESGRLFIQTSTGDTALYNTTNDTFKEVTLDTDKDISFGITGNYGDNIYTPTSDFTSIIKFAKNSTGFSPGRSWTDELEGTSIADIAIDGSVYVIDEAGQISKYHTGEAETFNNPTLIDELSSDLKIYTEEGLSNLYILDRDNNRIVIINKETQNLTAQLQTDALADAFDLVYYQRNKKIYVITGSQIIVIDASEFEE